MILAAVPGGVVHLVVTADGSATGRLLADDFGFMSMRGHSPAHPTSAELLALIQGGGDSRPGLAMSAMLEGREIPAFWPLAMLRFLPFVDRIFLAPGSIAMVALDDCSWIRLDVGEGRVTQGGARRLWDLLETLYRTLEEHNSPGRDRLGFTVRPDGSQWVWLDRPDQGCAWELHRSDPQP